MDLSCATGRAHSRTASWPIRRAGSQSPIGADATSTGINKDGPGFPGPSGILASSPSLVGWQVLLDRSIDQHLASLQSSALLSTFSPTFCTSLPAPAMVLQAVRVNVENEASSNRANKRFMGNLL